jgi:hypothetical protein
MSVGIGELYGLGGFNILDEYNESYHLRKIGVTAVESCISEKQRSGPEIHPDLAWNSPALTHYATFNVYTDMTGLERAVTHYGLDALDNFDEGSLYTMRTTDTPKQRLEGNKRNATNWNVAAHNLSRIYDYFVSIGGSLKADSLAADIWYISSLLHKAYGQHEQLAQMWLPDHESYSKDNGFVQNYPNKKLGGKR